MLSVCIPVYNKNITFLLTELNRQAVSLDPWVELLVFDDGSTVPVVDIPSLFPRINILRGEGNAGRSAARNRLCHQAKGPYLLFLDSGTQGINPRFLEDWLTVLKTGKSLVFYGGSTYSSIPPEVSFQLRWRVSIARESKPLAFRKAYPTAFKTNNAVIHRQVFDALKFDEALVAYGHEDTLFGFELTQLGIEVQQVDIPIVNELKDSNEAFLNKTKNAVGNLVLACDRSSSPKQFIQYVKLLKVYDKIKKFGLRFVLTVFENTLFVRLESKLLKASTFLLLQRFDLYKLLLLHKNMREKTKVDGAV
jgi:glycosyltransferase involved in cell wall biosynthesis